jgi:hypothetical protein
VVAFRVAVGVRVVRQVQIDAVGDPVRLLALDPLDIEVHALRRGRLEPAARPRTLSFADGKRHARGTAGDLDGLIAGTHQLGRMVRR